MEQYFAFQLHITDNCDQRCLHCYIFSEDNNLKIKEMAFSDVQKVLHNCIEMCEKVNRIPYFYITGGDPLLHKDFWQILDILKSNDISFSILGNPFHLDDAVCKKLYNYGCERYQISIDGRKNTHDNIRKPGSFETSIEKIPCLRNAGIKSVIMTTVSKMNISEIPEIIDIVVENKVDIFAFARYCPTRSDKDTHITPLEYKELLERCWQKFEVYKDTNTTFNLKDHLWTLFLYEKGLFTIPGNLEENIIYDGCNCGNSHLTILPDGNIFACRRFESNVGNVFSDRLCDVFSGPQMEKYRKYSSFKKCSKCELLRFCRGCPAVAYSYTYDFYAADPQCWKEV